MSADARLMSVREYAYQASRLRIALAVRGATLKIADPIVAEQLRAVSRDQYYHKVARVQMKARGYITDL